MGNIEVKNKNVYTLIACSCSSFLCHWENQTGLKANICSTLGCIEKNDIVGAHVIKCHGNSNSSQYITPLCKKCNSSHNTDCFKLKTNSKLVPVVTNGIKCKSC
jgi:hypothetical protein